MAAGIGYICSFFSTRVTTPTGLCIARVQSTVCRAGFSSTHSPGCAAAQQMRLCVWLLLPLPPQRCTQHKPHPDA